MERTVGRRVSRKAGGEPPSQARPAKVTTLQDRLGNGGVLALLQARRAAGAGGSATRQLVDRGVSGAREPLPYRDRIQASFGHHDVGGIEAHTGGAAREATAALGAHGYTRGKSVAFAGTPSLHTAAHEAAHVIQQRMGVHLKNGFGQPGDTHERHADAIADRVVRGEAAEPLLDQYRSGGGEGGGGSDGVQLSLVSTTPLAGSGTFSINMITVTPAAAGGAAGFDGWIQFTPTAGAPNSNTIGFWQIAKVSRVGAPGTDVGIASLSPAAAPRGALGQPGLRTTDNAATGVVGGFFVDRNRGAAAGDPISRRFNAEPAPAGTPAGFGAQGPNPRGGTGGVAGQTPTGSTPGFKRSDDPSDIKSTSLYDVPGFAGASDFEFESVARGEDTQINYGTISWGFGTRTTGPGGAAVVVNEHSAVTGGTSATFAEAVERHRDFYVHEPVTIYFAFDHDDISAVEEAKITGLAGYLGRNTAVRMTLDGFADLIGNAAYNVDLSQRRVRSVQQSILAHFPTANVVVNPVVAGGGHGISTAATDATSEQPAGTSDQPGAVAATGADQNREANRQFNRRVTITFSHPAGTGPAAPGGVGNPAPPAPAPAPGP
jgi:outer membrane protein OmpA-like peptidoglycan-associated protein